MWLSHSQGASCLLLPAKRAKPAASKLSSRAQGSDRSRAGHGRSRIAGKQAINGHDGTRLPRTRGGTVVTGQPIRPWGDGMSCAAGNPTRPGLPLENGLGLARTEQSIQEKFDDVPNGTGLDRNPEATQHRHHDELHGRGCQIGPDAVALQNMRTPAERPGASIRHWAVWRERSLAGSQPPSARHSWDRRYGGVG